MGFHMHNKRLSALLILLLTLGAATTARAEEEFLLPEQAFRISGHAEQPDRVIVSWAIADGYYLYRSKLKFRSQTVGIETGHPSTPPGEIRDDEFFGEVEIYRRQVDVALPLERAPGTEDILTLEATSQGCADAGLCYPPHKQTILLELPKLAAAEPSQRE